jgi:hypothetical protein
MTAREKLLNYMASNTDLLTKEQATRVAALTESREVKRVAAVAPGSLPVPASEILRVASALEDNATTRDAIVDPVTALYEWEARSKREAAALRYCAAVLKRHAEYISRQVEHSNERQPEENNRDVGRDDSAAPKQSTD